jgi:serine/threonine protein kinase
MSTANTQQVTPDLIVQMLRKSGLVEEQEVAAFLAGPAREAAPSSPRAMAQLLIQHALITPFHARQLLQGKYQGFIVNQKYKVLEMIAQGGMGTVFLCEHILMRRLVAMKVLPKVMSSGTVERFLREARAVASLDHPNIVRAYDLERLPPSNAPFFVMEYVDGIDLHRLVSERGELPVPRAVNYLVQAAAGLQHAHEGGWVHRDIKPSNLLLSRQGQLKILDMGLARLLSDKADNLTHRHDNKSVLGTADYMSPEQAVASSDVDIRADIYSLGATAYLLLTRTPPFPEGTMTQKLLWHQTVTPASVHQRRPDVPAGLSAVIDRMMAKDRKDRYQTPAEVVQALAPWCPPVVSPPAPAEIPAHCPAVEKYRLSEGGRSLAWAPSPQGYVGNLPLPDSSHGLPFGSGSNPGSSQVDLVGQPAVWRGRVIGDTSSASGVRTPRPAGYPSSPGMPAVPESAPNPGGKIWTAVVVTVVAIVLSVIALAAYRANLPRTTAPAPAALAPSAPKSE